MAYRFNNGRGAVTCDDCGVIFDQNLSVEEYLEYRKDLRITVDLCVECHGKRRKKEEEKKIGG